MLKRSSSWMGKPQDFSEGFPAKYLPRINLLFTCRIGNGKMVDIDTVILNEMSKLKHLSFEQLLEMPEHSTGKNSGKR